LQPYESGPFDLKLGKDDERALGSGKPVMKQKESKGELGGGAICVQDIEAPKEAVWSQILDLDSYKGKVPKVNNCNNYEVMQNSDGTCTIKTKMVIGVIPGYSVSCMLVHSPSLQAATNTLVLVSFARTIYSQISFTRDAVYFIL